MIKFEVRDSSGLLVLPLMLVTACSGGTGPSSETTTPPEPAEIMIVSGDSQVAVAGTALPDSLVVRSLDGGIPSRFTLDWTVKSGAGSVGVQKTSTADRDGATGNTWTLGPDVGVQILEVSSGSMRVTFTATATPSNGSGS